MRAPPVDPRRASIEHAAGATIQSLPATLRRLRERRGVTLAALSALTGASVSTLSRLESGQRRPTVELVLRIALALGISPGALIGAPIAVSDPAERAQPTAELLADEAAPDSQKATPLTPRRAGLRAFRIALPANAPLPQQRAHGGHEWIFVLSGRLRVRMGPHELHMGPGDALEFPGSRPHAFAAAGAAPAQVLALLSGPGELVHTTTQAGVPRAA